MTEIDFDKLNRDLEERAAKRGTWISMPFSFDYFFSTNFFFSQIRKKLRTAEAYTDIDYYFDLDSSGIKLFIKRIIRKMNKFLFLRNFETQRKYNALTLETETLLYRSLIGMQKQHEHDRAVIQSLEARLDKLEASNG